MTSLETNGATAFAVAVFVKTPGLSPLKTRLAAGIGAQDAGTFYGLACRAVRSVLEAARDELGITPYWAVAEAGGARLWQDFPVVLQGDGELGPRLDKVYAELLAKHGSVCLIGADAPQISLMTIRGARAALSGDRPFALGGANDGGFFLIAGRDPIPRAAWTSVPYSRPETGASMEEALLPLGGALRLPSLTDVDEADDLAALTSELAALEVRTPEQDELMIWLDSRR